MREPQKRLALLIGIDRYLHLPAEQHLQGAVRDAEAMADLLATRFGFPADGIQLLRNEEATRSAVLSSLTRLSEEVDQDTSVVVHWSGHGSQTPSLEPEGTGLDETLVPWDARVGGLPDITDKELLAILRPIAKQGAFLTLIADTCHSGHLYREQRFGRTRWVSRGFSSCNPTTVRGKAPAMTSALCQRNQQVMLAACRADQEAFEIPFGNGEAHGAWTFALLETLRKSPTDATARQIFEPALRYLVSDNPRQIPQLIGAHDRLIFGVTSRPPCRFVQIEGRQGSLVKLTAGRAHGIATGSLWDVHTAETESPRPDQEAVRVRVTRVLAFTSEAEIAGKTPSRQIEANDRAFEILPAYDEFRPAVRIPGRGGALDRELEQRIRNSPMLRPADADEEAQCFVEFEPRLRIFDSSGFELVPRFAEDDPQLAQRVVERLEKRARWWHGKRLTNKDPESRVQATLRARLLHQTASGKWLPVSEFPRDSQLDLPEWHSGESIALEISHGFPSYLFVYVLDFGLTDNVTQIFPPVGGQEPLFPGTFLKPGTIIDDELEIWLPDELEAAGGGVEFLKVIATTHATDFSCLRTDVPWPLRLRSGPLSLSHLLHFGGEGPVLRNRTEDWGALLLPFQLRPKKID